MKAKIMETFRYGELYCGPGGLALGAMKAKVRKAGSTYGFRHAWASDYDEDSCRTYRRNICPDHPDSVFCCDVRDLDIKALPKIDAFAYGFPCNDFSIVGEKLGFDGKFGPLYSYGVKVLDYFKPVFFVAENVSGLSSAHSGQALRKILADLETAGDGYKLTPHLYRFEEYGVPQTRHRIIIVGIASKIGLKFKVPKPTTASAHVAVRSAIEIPPISARASNQERTRQDKIVEERLKLIQPGQNCWQADLPEHLRLNVKQARLSHIYKRLHPDKPSYTVTGSGGGGTHVYHYDEPRALTNRERARIQTFPDSFVFEGSKESVRKQIGMAVSPRMSELIFRCILKTLVGQTYEHLDSENISNETDQFLIPGLK